MSEAFLVSLYAQSDTVRLKFFHIHSGMILFIIIFNTDDHLTVKFKDLDIGLKNERSKYFDGMVISKLVEKMYLKYH